MWAIISSTSPSSAWSAAMSQRVSPVPTMTTVVASGSSVATEPLESSRKAREHHEQRQREDDDPATAGQAEVWSGRAA